MDGGMTRDAQTATRNARDTMAPLLSPLFAYVRI